MVSTPRKAVVAKASSGGASPKKALRTSRSAKAGLVFPVAHVRALLRRGQSAARVGSSAATYLTAVLEYITTELLEVAGHEQLGPEEDEEHATPTTFRNSSSASTKKAKKPSGRIGSRTLTLAVASDEELATLLRSVMMSGGGFVDKHHKP